MSGALIAVSDPALAGVLIWAGTYLVHSTSWVAGAALLHAGVGRRLGGQARNLLWRVALLGPLLSTPVQIAAGGQWSLHTFRVAATAAAPQVTAPAAGTAPRVAGGPAVATAQALALAAGVEASATAAAQAPARARIAGMGRGTGPRRPAPVRIATEAALAPAPGAGRLSRATADRIEGNARRKAHAGAVPITAWTGETAPAALAIAGAQLPVIAGARPAITGSGAGGAWGWAALAAAIAGLALARLARVAIRLRRWRWRLADRTPVHDPVVREVLHDLCRRVRWPGRIRLTESAGLETPVALWGGEICLPLGATEALDRRGLQAVLAHELAHIERRDNGWLALAAVLESLLFLQPLIGWARRRLQETAELASDERAVELTGDPLGLARSLAEVAAWGLGEPTAGALASPVVSARGPLLRRVEALLAGERRRAGARWMSPLLVAGLALVTLLAPALALDTGVGAQTTVSPSGAGVQPAKAVTAAASAPSSEPAPSWKPPPAAASPTDKKPPPATAAPASPPDKKPPPSVASPPAGAKPAPPTAAPPPPTDVKPPPLPAAPLPPAAVDVKPAPATAAPLPPAAVDVKPAPATAAPPSPAAPVATPRPPHPPAPPAGWVTPVAPKPPAPPKPPRAPLPATPWTIVGPSRVVLPRMQALRGPDRLDPDRAYVYVDEDGQTRSSSGSRSDLREVDALASDTPRPFLWVRRGRERLVVTGEKTLDPLHDLIRQQSKLGDKQAKLGHQQAELGDKQAELGRQQATLGRQQSELGRGQAALAGRQAEIAGRHARFHAQAQGSRRRGPGCGECVDGSQQAALRRLSEDLERLQRDLGRQQSELGKRQSELGHEQGELGRKQGDLGRQMGDLGRKQGDLGRQQGEIGRRIGETIDRIVGEAREKGTARVLAPGSR